MDSIFEKINDWLKDFLAGSITNNLMGMFDEVNTKVTEIAGQVGKTPSGWNGEIFSMIRNLSETVIIPIAGMVLTFVVCYELINMVIEKNNLHDGDTWFLFKWIFKTFIAIYLVTHTFDITMAFFDLAQNVVQKCSGVISNDVKIDLSAALQNLESNLESMELAGLFGLWIESLLIGLATKALSLIIFIILYGHMMEIYLYCSIAPIPFSTMCNHEWGNIGTNYIRGLAALAFQAFFILVCVGIYAVLVKTIALSGNINTAIWSCAGYSVLLCFSLLKTGSLSKSIFNAH